MKPLVVDLSHHNWDGGAKLDFAAAKAAGIAGVIYKATEGTNYRDPFFQKTRDAVHAAGLLWGAYHFATATDSAQQAKNFLDLVKPDAHTLVALDFEHNEPHPANTTNSAIATDILKRFEDAIGRVPKLYTGGFMFDCFGDAPHEEFAKYPLWLACYASTAKIHPTWDSYWLWQYTDGAKGPQAHGVSGIGSCDCDYYAGPAEQLASEWA